MNNNKKVALLSGLIILIIILLIGISWNSNNTNKTFKLGVIAPLTGDFGAVGENVLKGIKTAEIVYEKKTGNKIDIIAENDNADAATGLSAYYKLTQIDQVNGLINTFTSTMDSIYEPSKKLGYPVMMEFLQANNVSDDYVFQMTLGNDHVWDRYAKYILDSKIDQSKVVVLHSIDAAQSSFAKAFNLAYGKKVTEFTIGNDKNELRFDATKIAGEKPTLIILFMTPENGAILTKDILPLINAKTQLAYDIQLTTGMSYYLQQLGGDLSKINGSIALMFEGDQNSAEYKEFLSEYEKLYKGEKPGFLADYGYDTFLTYMNSYDKDNAKWINNLNNFAGKGASGDIKFDEKGVRISPLVIKSVTGGQLQTISKLP
ncbi:MAG: ABC transporter substrate-binding protein [Candidatus Taylorbacteria bacterium]|nr:ABC transporter substrate-binding protein [Candidatus Taylorbacteria bacterium]